MSTVVDDVGSYPLPSKVDGSVFERAYQAARKSIIERKPLEKDEFITRNFSQVVTSSFIEKIDAGLDVVNYPQHYDMHRQLSDVLKESMNEGTYAISQQRAFLPEVTVIKQEAKEICEQTGKRIRLRVCLVGPIELYSREIGGVVHKDVLQTLAENAKRFAQNSILNSKYVQTVAVSLDEPSFGFQDILIDWETIHKTLETAFSFTGAARQIHLHSPSRITDLLNVDNIDVLSIEYAASPKNIDSVSKSMLDQADKQIRVGVSRTDINSITAELYDKGVKRPTDEQLVEEELKILKRFETAKAKYEERMTFTGPDCGLGGWPTANAARLLLTRTVKAVKSAKNP